MDATRSRSWGDRAGSRLLVMTRVIPLDPEPSNQVLRALFRTERFRGEWRPHWIRLAREIGLGCGVGVLAGAVRRAQTGRPATLPVWAGVLAWSAWRTAAWHRNRLVLTNHRLIVATGVFRRTVAQAPLDRSS